MTTLDLQPLTDETIQELGYDSHELWLVKIEDESFGPFETESLKDYASENEEQFQDAQATRMDNIEYASFWSYPHFQRRKVQVVTSEQHEGPFWIMVQGLKVGPLSFRDIDKKIEMDILGMTDHISTDDGQVWQKIYQIDGFDRRIHSPEELPVAPSENEFYRAKLALVDKLEEREPEASLEIAGMAHIAQKQAKVIPFKIDEMSLQMKRETEVSSALSKFMPTAAAIFFTVVTGGYFLFSEPSSETTVADISQIKIKEKKVNTPPRGVIPSGATRLPASVGYTNPAPKPQSYDQSSRSRYPVHMETHESYNNEFPEEAYYDQETPEVPVFEGREPAQEVHSLVGTDPRDQDVSLDAAMNGIDQPAEPTVEELSDF